MFNAFCGCFNFWSSNDEQADFNNLSQIDQPDVCLDVSKAGEIKLVYFNLFKKLKLILDLRRS